MKHLLLYLLVGLMIGCGEKKKEEAASQPLSKRYFYIGYDIRNKTGYNVGNFTYTSDTLPSKEFFKSLMYEQYKCQGWLRKEIIITSISEFRDSIDYNKWVNPDGNPIDTCFIFPTTSVGSNEISKSNNDSIRFETMGKLNIDSLKAKP